MYDRAQGFFFGSLWAACLCLIFLAVYPPFQVGMLLGSFLGGGAIGALAPALLSALVPSLRNLRALVSQAMGGAWLGFLIGGAIMIPGGLMEVHSGKTEFSTFVLMTLGSAAAGSLGGFILGFRDALVGKK